MTQLGGAPSNRIARFALFVGDEAARRSLREVSKMTHPSAEIEEAWLWGRYSLGSLWCQK